MSLFDGRRHAPLPAEGYLPGFDGATGGSPSRPQRLRESLPGSTADVLQRSDRLTSVPALTKTEIEEDLKEFCCGKIARFKIPQFVRMVDEFPMTVTGKVQKYKMREIEISERGLSETPTT